MPSTHNSAVCAIFATYSRTSFPRALFLFMGSAVTARPRCLTVRLAVSVGVRSRIGHLLYRVPTRHEYQMLVSPPLEQPRFFLAVLPLLNSSLAPERRSSHCGAGSMPSTPNLASVSVCTYCSRACSSCPRMTLPSGILSACSSLLRAHFELQPRHAWENRLAPNHARHSCTAARDIGGCGCFVSNQIFMHSGPKDALPSDARY
jgi:hypothetical protein